MNCAAPFALTCPECGTELPPQAKFCFNCAAQVAVPVPGPSEAVAQRLQRLVPREFAERLLATRGQMAGERRIVTMLFSDVKGSTRMAERLDPEDVLEIMDGAFDVLIEPITRYEGALARLMGDGILAFFGAPIAHEDDAERACRAALEIIEGARGYAARLEEERGISGFNVRVGIHTGLVVVGEVGSDLRVEYTAMGDAVNLASRMETAAEPGTVLITEDTHRLIAPLFETEALGPTEVRGKGEPVSVYRVLASRVVAGKARGIEGLESPLVGRDAEFEALREVLEQLQAGVGGIVTIVGEAGIGKSRLVAELRKEVAPLGVRWVEGRCLSYGESMAYLPWVDILQGLLGVSAEDAPAEVRETLREWVRALCPDHFDEAYPFLGRMMSLPLEPQVEERLGGLEPEGLKVLTFRAVERVLETATSQGTVVLVCEDLHWADVSSLQLLEQMLALTDRCALLLLCAFRPYREHGCWGIREAAGRQYPHRHVDLLLRPLSALDSEALVSNLLHVEALPHPLRMRILDHAEGNPFYVEEVIRSLIDSGTIVYDEAMAQWEATRRVEDIAIPDTLQGVLTARIDRLDEEARRVLQMASVIGRIFPYRILSAIAGEEQEHPEQTGPEPGRRVLAGHLLTLQREEMIRQRARVPELEYIFKHHLTQQAAYNGLLRQERRSFHRQVAEAWEQLFPDRFEEQLGLLAHHWEQAGDPETAVEYLRRAGEQAAAQFANEEAVAYFTRALELTPEGDLVARYDLLLAREEVYEVQAMREASAQDVATLEELAEALDDDRRRAEVALRQSRDAGRSGNHAERVAMAQKAIRLGRAIGDLTAQAAGHRLWAWALQHRDRDEARSHFEVALVLARAAESRREEADVLYNLGIAHYFWGQSASSRAYAEQALGIYREIGDRMGEGKALDDIGVAFLIQGEYDQARAIFEEELRICRETGDRELEQFALIYLGTVFDQLGSYPKTKGYYGQALEIVRDIGRLPLLSMYLGALSHHLGDDESAQDYAQQALLEGASHRIGSLARTILGNARVGLGQLPEAVDAYHRALALAREVDAPPQVMEALSGLARVSLAQGDLHEAEPHVDEILAYLQASTLDGTFEPARVYLTCYRVLKANDDPRAQKVLEDAYRFLQDRAARISDEEDRRSYLENVAANRELVEEWTRRREDVTAKPKD